MQFRAAKAHSLAEARICSRVPENAGKDFLTCMFGGAVTPDNLLSRGSNMPLSKNQPGTLPGQHGNHAKEVLRVTAIGLAANLLLSVLKFVCGVVGASQAVVADAVHSLSDSSTDLAILVGVQYWSRPADTSHPHGHRRIETVVTISIGVVLAVVGAGLAFRALSTLQGQHADRPGWIAFAAALLSIASKEVLYRWTSRTGRRIKSSAVIANAWHHRSDAFSSIPAALAVAGAKLKPGWYFLDHVGAVVVSVFILGAAVRIIWPALEQLVDAGAAQKDVDSIKQIAVDVPGVEVVHAIRTRRLGLALQVDLHILVDGGMTVQEGHDISEQVTQRLLAGGPDIVDVVVHVEPHEGS